MGNIAVFDVGGEGERGGGEKIEQVDSLGYGLGQAGNGGHIDEQQGASAHSKAGKYPGTRSGGQGNDPAHQNNRVRTPP